jgi:aldehyde dehydrogenase (NAD+)
MLRSAYHRQAWRIPVRASEEMVTGEVHINGYTRSANRPFGGIGLSGMGREGGRAGIEEFPQVKGVSVS